MRILKSKVAKALDRQKKTRRTARTTEAKSLIKENGPILSPDTTTNKRPVRQRQLPAKVIAQNLEALHRVSTSSKNIMKNYSRALTNFALSELAIPYLPDLLLRYGVDEEEFRQHIKGRKEKVNCIKSLRELLLVEEGDTEQIRGAKIIFKELSIIFMKAFSVNWVFHSKVEDKITHLKYRFKIQRRLQNPELFTYLEDFNK